MRSFRPCFGDLQSCNPAVRLFAGRFHTSENSSPLQCIYPETHPIRFAFKGPRTTDAPASVPKLCPNLFCRSHRGCFLSESTFPRVL